jgi:hypothetical protein
MQRLSDLRKTGDIKNLVDSFMNYFAPKGSEKFPDKVVIIKNCT